MLTEKEIIGLLELKPLSIEGGYFKETWKSPKTIEEKNGLPAGTAIYYLLTKEPGVVSRMHKLCSEEIWHFYCGEPVSLLLLHPDGKGEVRRLGVDLKKGERPQIVVPAGVWQGAALSAVLDGDAVDRDAVDRDAGLALLGTTMAPGFLPENFTPGHGGELSVQYPEFEKLIRMLS